MVDVVLSGYDDNDSFDRGAGELEGAAVGVVGCHWRGAVASDADTVSDEAERAGLGDDCTGADFLVVDVERRGPGETGHRGIGVRSVDDESHRECVTAGRDLRAG